MNECRMRWVIFTMIMPCCYLLLKSTTGYMNPICTTRALLRRHGLKSFLTTASSSNSQLESRVKRFLLNECEVNPSDQILLSVSGGVDSVAMLHLMASIRMRYLPNVKLRIIHFNHKKREESEEEAVFVRSLAEMYSIPLIIREADSVYPAEDKEEEDEVGDEMMKEENRSFRSSNFQASARMWRRENSESLLTEWAKEERKAGGDEEDCFGGRRYHIATAHHLDDSIETFMLKLLRGTHLSSLHGVCQDFFYSIVSS